MSGDVELGCLLPQSQVEKAGQRCGRGDGASVTCRDFQEMRSDTWSGSYRILATIVTVTIIVAVIIAVTVVTVLQDNSDGRLYTKSKQDLIIHEKNGIDEEAS